MSKYQELVQNPPKLTVKKEAREVQKKLNL